MMKRFLACMLCTSIAVLSLITVYAQPPSETKPVVAQAGADAEVQAILRHYTEVYNKHDAKGLSEFWAEQGSSSDATGDRVVGRDAVRADFEATFKENPKSRLSVRLKNYRYIKPDLLSICGEATITGATEDEITVVNFTTLLMKHGEKWLVEESTESPVAVPSTPFDGLKELGWLVGTWKDDVEGINVNTEFKWSDNKNFLLRKYTIETADDPTPQSGTQVIAWDPRSKSIRSWTFSLDGSFGEGAWSQSGSEWHVKFNHTNANGTLLSGMQILNKTGSDTITVQVIGQEEDGEPQPNGPVVKMIRRAPAAK
jgi:uncharacterized protein (TIGR02246 family)